MKILKLFFSRFFIVALAIILQVFVFFATNFWLSESFGWVAYWFTALGILLFFVIINKDKRASFKLPWISVILIFPVLGITVYLTFGNVNLSKKSRRKLEKENKILRQFCKQNESTMRELYQSDHQAYGQAKYIQSACLLPTYNRCYSEYLPTGEIFFAQLVDELKKARKYILMEYFIIEKGTMWDTIYQILIAKAKQGVEVHFMYDDVGSISKVPNDYFYEMRNHGINACKFFPFRPIVSVIHNNRDHRKITVIDGEVGFIGGINLADEYINVKHPYGRWKDNAVLLKGKCVDSLIRLFIQLFNSQTLRKLDIKQYLPEHHQTYKMKGFIAPYGDGPCPIYEDYVGENVYLNIIGQAEHYLYITTPYLVVDYEFLAALSNAAKRGVDVRIITPYIADKKLIKIMTKSNYMKLIEAGVKIYEYKPGFIHAKMFVCDDKYATVGTINLDYRSFVHHFECGVWFYNTSCIDKMRRDFLAMIRKESVSIDRKRATLKPGERIIKDILRLIAPMM